MGVAKVAEAWLLRQARKDMENLAPAIEIYNALRKTLKRGEGIVFYGQEGRAVVYARTLGLRHLGKLVDKLNFVFSSHPSIAYYGKSQRITIPLRMGLSSKNYKEQVERVVSQRREVIIHELVHHLDGHRVKTENWAEAHKSYKDPKEDPEGYYNHPIEMNAFFQMAAAKVTAEYQDILSDLEPDTGPDNEGSSAHQSAVWALDIITETPWSKFFKDWKRGQRDDGKWWDHLTPKNKRRMQKRVYDLYGKTVLDAKRRLGDLKRRGDPMEGML